MPPPQSRSKLVSYACAIRRIRRLIQVEVFRPHSDLDSLLSFFMYLLVLDCRVGRRYMPYMHTSAWVGIPFLRFSFAAYSVLFYEAPARARMLLLILVGGSAFLGINTHKVGTCSVRFSHVLPGMYERCVCRYACVQALTPPHVFHGLGFLLAFYPRYRSYCIIPKVFFHLSVIIVVCAV